MTQSPLETMRAAVRCDLRDEAAPYLWPDSELDRAIARALLDYSRFRPRLMKDAVATVNGRDYVDISVLGCRSDVYRVEFPVNRRPRCYQPFRVYMNHLIFEGREIGNGQDCHIEWGRIHTLDDTADTVAPEDRHLLALGAAAHAALSMSVDTINAINQGGAGVDRDYARWGKDAMARFEAGLKRLARTVRPGRLVPESPPGGG